MRATALYSSQTETDNVQEYSYDEKGRILEFKIIKLGKLSSSKKYDYETNTVTLELADGETKVNKYSFLIQGRNGPEQGEFDLYAIPDVVGLGVIEGEYAKGSVTGSCTNEGSVYSCTSTQPGGEVRENTYQLVRVKVEGEASLEFDDYLTLKSKNNSFDISNSFNKFGLKVKAIYKSGTENTYTYDDTGVNLLNSSVGGRLTTCEY